MKQRDYYFDNAKFILILLVVFGHFLRSFIHENELILTLYKTIYSFHMPAFILVSGYFAKGFGKEGYLKKVAKKLVLPYFIFQAIYSLFYYAIETKDTLAVNPFDPHWSLWFLLSLFFWNVLLSVFAKMPMNLALGSAFAIGIGIGYVEGVDNYLSLSRTFVFFPLFLLGFYMKKEHFKKIKAPKFQAVSILILSATFMMYYILPNFNFQWLFGSKPYVRLISEVWEGGLIRTGFYLISLVTTICFLSLIPKGKYFFTEWGTRTFYVYLLHGFVVKYLRTSEWMEYLKDSENIIIIAAISLILTFILSSPWVRAVAQPVIELKMSAIRKMAGAAGSGQARTKAQ